MEKIYNRINWENYTSTATPLSAANLNTMDSGIDAIDSRVVDMDSQIASKINKPESEGESGEVLATDGEGGYYWANSVGVVDSLDSTSATSALSANMGKTLNETKQNKLVEGDHVSIDAQNVISVTDITSIEVESYTSTGTHIADITLDGVKTELYAPAGGGASVEVIDNLNSTSATSALSANQGRVLQSEVDDLSKYESTDYSGNGLTFTASKLGRIVQMNFHSGSTSGSVSAWTTIATLDSKYRPNKNMYYRDSYSNKLLYVGTNGLVQFAENVDSGVAFRSIQLFIK